LEADPSSGQLLALCRDDSRNRIPKRKNKFKRKTQNANRHSLRLAAGFSKSAAFSGNSEERSFVAALLPLNAFGSSFLVAARKALAALSG